MRSLMVLILAATSAWSDLPNQTVADRNQRSAIEQMAVPCLQPRPPSRYVVTWWIENKLTGEKRQAGRQEIIRSC